MSVAPYMIAVHEVRINEWVIQAFHRVIVEISSSFNKNPYTPCYFSRYIYAKWIFQFNLLSMKTPRNLLAFVSKISWLSIWRWIFAFPSFLVNIMYCVCFTFKDNLLTFNHCDIPASSSSTVISILDKSSLWRTSLYRKNWKRLRTDVCQIIYIKYKQ